MSIGASAVDYLFPAGVDPSSARWNFTVLVPGASGSAFLIPNTGGDPWMVGLFWGRYNTAGGGSTRYFLPQLFTQTRGGTAGGGATINADLAWQSVGPQGIAGGTEANVIAGVDVDPVLANPTGGGPVAITCQLPRVVMQPGDGWIFDIDGGLPADSWTIDPSCWYLTFPGGPVGGEQAVPPTPVATPFIV